MDKRSISKKNTISFVIFLDLGIFVFSYVQDWFKSQDIPTYQGFKGFYKERKNSLDAVYIGSSNVYYYWQSPLAWGNHGMAVWNYNAGAMPAEALPYLMNEVRKTQSDPLFIINLNIIHEVEIDAAKIHRVTHYLRPSFNKFRMISSLSDDAGYEGLEKLEFFFPIIRFHSKWAELSSWDFNKKINNMKLGLYNSFFYKIADMENRYRLHEGEAELGQIQSRTLFTLLDYCDENNLKVLFVIVPQAISADNVLGKQLNRMESIVNERGYDCLNLLGKTDEIGLQKGSDFRDSQHTNIHGAIKYTEYLSKYLSSKYGIEDKRGRSEYKTWDRAAEIYYTTISPYTLSFEREHAPRNYNIDAPQINQPEIYGQTVTLSWEASKQASLYEIYRKSKTSGEENWTLIASVDNKTLEISDEDLQTTGSYTYTVVPVSVSDNEKYYGNFDYSGVKANIK